MFWRAWYNTLLMIPFQHRVQGALSTSRVEPCSGFRVIRPKTGIFTRIYTEGR